MAGTVGSWSAGLVERSIGGATGGCIQCVRERCYTIYMHTRHSGQFSGHTGWE